MFHVEQFLDLLLPGSDKPLVIQRFEYIKEEYFKWNKKINLSSIRDEKGFWEKHVLDSLCLASYIKEAGFDGFEIFDIGSGGGFPGLIISSVFNNKIIMVDPIKKKTDFLSHIILRLGLKHAGVYTGFFEDIKECSPKTLIVSRALGRYDELNRHFKQISESIDLLVMATEAQLVGMKGVVSKKQYDLVNPLVENSLKGHILLKIS